MGSYPVSFMVINFNKMSWMIERIQLFKLALQIYRFKGRVIVDENTASIRANTCVACHNNVPAIEARTGCYLCSNEEKEVIEQVEKTILQWRVDEHDDNLKSCDIDGSCNKLAVWLFPEYLLNKEQANEFPCYCWKKEVL